MFMILFFHAWKDVYMYITSDIPHGEISSRNTIYSCCKRFHLYMSWSAMVLLKLYKQFKVSGESRLLIRKGLGTNDNIIV